MARPIKAGLNYFPFDVCDCRGIKLIEAKFGLTGFAVITKLLQAVYGGMGYFCPLDQETLLLFASECRLPEETIRSIAEAAVHWEIFDREKYEKYHILTSLEIQKCYLTAVGRRQRIDFDSRYLLLPPELQTENIWIDGVNVYKNRVNVCRNPENVCNNSQRKEKQSKEKEKKAEEKKADTDAAEAAPPLPAASDHTGVLKHAKGCFGAVTAKAESFLLSCLDGGMEPELLCAAMDEAVEYGKPSWQYARAVLEDKRKKGIKTLPAFAENKAEFQRQKPKPPARSPSPSRLCNYSDANPTDDAAISDMLFSQFWNAP